MCFGRVFENGGVVGARPCIFNLSFLRIFPAEYVVGESSDKVRLLAIPSQKLYPNYRFLSFLSNVLPGIMSSCIDILKRHEASGPLLSAPTPDTEKAGDEQGTTTGPRITTAGLQKICMEQANVHATPALNNTLMISFKGYRKIENLDAYTGLRALHAEANGFTVLEGLFELRQLRALYLKSNLIAKIEGLDTLQNLVTLDLSENSITKLEGLSSLPNLSTLNVSKNSLKNVDSIRHVEDCKALTSVDLSNNCISTICRDDGDDDGNRGGEDDENANANTNDIIDLLSKCHGVTALNLAGNPVSNNEISHFRKKLIVALKSLNYLDRPVFDQERAMAEAWSIGGREAEARTKKEWQERERNANRQGIEDYRKWQERMRKEAIEKPSKVREAESAERARQKEERLAEARKETALERQKYALDEEKAEEKKVEEKMKDSDVEDVDDDDDEDDDEGPPPLVDNTNATIPVATVGMKADVGSPDSKADDAKGSSIPKELTDEVPEEPPKDQPSEEFSLLPVSSPTPTIVEAKMASEPKTDDGAALIRESLEILRKQKESIRLAKGTTESSAFCWNDELDSALIRHATATGFDINDTLERLSKAFPSLVVSLDESLMMQRLGVLGLLPTSATLEGKGQDERSEDNCLTTAAGIPLIAGKRDLTKSSTKRIVPPPVKLPSSCDDVASDLDASFDAFVEKRGVLAGAEKECGVEDADKDVNVSMDSAGDVFFDAKETLSPTK